MRRGGGLHGRRGVRRSIPLALGKTVVRLCLPPGLRVYAGVTLATDFRHQGKRLPDRAEIGLRQSGRMRPPIPRGSGVGSGSGRKAWIFVRAPVRRSMQRIRAVALVSIRAGLGARPGVLVVRDRDW